MRRARAFLALALVLLLLGFSFNAYACIVPLYGGANAAELYSPAIEQRLVSRLDHAAYLGRELARAEGALRSGRPYVQDTAP